MSSGEIGHHVSGTGPPLVLLHALGESAADWRWVRPDLERTHRVHAIDLPGLGDHPQVLDDFSSSTLAGRVVDFCDAEGIERATFVGNSLGGQVALHVALQAPDRVSALGLIAAAGLGREVSVLLRAASAWGVGGTLAAWATTPVGAVQRCFGRAPLLFGDPRRAPGGWLTEQYRLARRPAFLAANLAALRAHVNPLGQREVLLDRLPAVAAPTLVIWGARDRVLPAAHGRAAVDRLPDGHLRILPGMGHLPQVEAPAVVATAIAHLAARGDERS